MSQKLPTNLKPKQLIKTLERHGFAKRKSRGSHIRFQHPDGRCTQVAVHNRPIPPGTLKAILRQTQLIVSDL